MRKKLSMGLAMLAVLTLWSAASGQKQSGGKGVDLESEMPADAHHLRFAQSKALGRKVSDEFTVPLCRGHHREVHRCGDEAQWWRNTGIDPSVAARSLWLENHPPRSGLEDLSSNQRRPIERRLPAPPTH